MVSTLPNFLSASIHSADRQQNLREKAQTLNENFKAGHRDIYKVLM